MTVDDFSGGIIDDGSWEIDSVSNLGESGRLIPWG